MRSFLIIAVIVVFGLLGGMLLLYLALDGDFSFNTTKPRVETKQLELALQAYQDMHVEYPPCFGEEDRTERRVRLMRHLTARNWRLSQGTSEAAYLRLREQVQNGFGPNSAGYNFKNAQGALEPLDLDMLDPAETLVFWLGGFPTPYDAAGVPIHANRLFGFYRDSYTLFKRDLQQEGTEPLAFRTEPLHDFDQSRLVDRDGDGWLEYAFTSDEAAAPIVYFDAATYTATTTAPSKDGAKKTEKNGAKEPVKEASIDVARLGTIRYPAAGSPLTEVWGQAVPYLEKFAPDKPVAAVWGKRDSFQLIAAGADQRFGPADTAVRRFVMFPSGHTWTTTDGTTYQIRELSSEEQDNVTNLSDVTLGEAAAAAATSAAEAAAAAEAAKTAAEQ